MSQRILQLFVTLSLVAGMTGWALAGTHADCIKNCIDVRASEGAACLQEKKAALKACETTRAECLAEAKDDKAKRACKKADLDCKEAAEKAYLQCIKTADEAVKKCKDDCLPDNKPTITPRNPEQGSKVMQPNAIPTNVR